MPKKKVQKTKWIKLQERLEKSVKVTKRNELYVGKDFICWTSKENKKGDKAVAEKCFATVLEIMDDLDDSELMHSEDR